MTKSEESGCCGHCTCQGEQAGSNRREFLNYSAAALGAVGAAAVAVPLIDTMNPAADTLALSTTEVDVSALKEGEAMTAMWRGKPVFIRRRTAEQMQEVRTVAMADLKDPQTDEERVAQSTFNGKAMPEYLVTIGVCTHLGCIPQGQKATEQHGEFGGWFCPCHGSQYDPSGRIRKGPAPKNLEIPTYAFIDATRIKIG